MSAGDAVDGVIAALEDRLRRMIRSGDAAQAAGLRALHVPLPHAGRGLDLRAGFVADGASLPAERFYWSRPAEGLSLLALGERAALEGHGPGRFRDVDRAAQRLFASLVACGPPVPADRGPLLVGGFSFADRPPADGAWRGFPAARLVLPEATVVRRGDDAWLCLVLPRQEPGDAPDPVAALPRVRSLLETLRSVPPGEPEGPPCGFEREGVRGMSGGPEYRVRADRSHADYRAQVTAARRAIAAGDLEKVVLARTLSVRHEGRFDRGALLARLETLYPDCVTFAVSRADACFLGATPERLVARSGARVDSGAVAGSAPRGRTPEEDARLGRALLESKKDQEEHAFVVRAVSRALAPLCSELVVGEAPRLLRIEGIQHLETKVHGRLRQRDGGAQPGAGPWPSLLELAERLHPTPAVGGAPRDAALAWIERCEGIDRGWYAGPVGFVDAAGDGELRVALRSGLIRGGGGSDATEEAVLFSGGGIVADSSPERELEETRIKLRALLAPLTEI